jgi:hypothetical protein
MKIVLAICFDADTILANSAARSSERKTRGILRSYELTIIENSGSRKLYKNAGYLAIFPTDSDDRC